MNLWMLIRTLAPLRREQLLWRPVRLAQRELYRRLPILTRRWTAESVTAPEVPIERLETYRNVLTEDLLHLDTDPRTVSDQIEQVREGRFTFLNRTIDLSQISGATSSESPDWNRRHGSHLWNFHLHYFPFVIGAAWHAANDRSREIFAPVQRLIEDWILRAQPGWSDGWEAYPVSVRVVNWIYGYVLLARDYPDRRFLDRWRGSIWRQLDFLSGHLELHLLANHLFRNVRALLIGGIFFDHLRWINKGSQLLWREIDEQFLPDGGHFERAPMYHAQTLADVVECVALLRRFGHPVPAAVEDRISRMADFLEALSYRDGRLALFNDSANTAETRPGPIIKAARRLTRAGLDRPPTQFPSSGYYLWHSIDGQEKMIIDAGPPSVSYNTAHAHCDLLSFELQLDGRPWIVDTGVHGYGGDQFRHYCRSTRAHNTISIDGLEQSEIWSTFRMGGKARIVDCIVNPSDGGWSFRATATHFTRSQPRHERCIDRDTGGTWTITDRIIGAFRRAESFLHLHPDLEVEMEGDGSYRLRSESVVRRLTITGGMSTRLIEAGDGCPDGWYFPEFGLAQPGKMIIGQFTGSPGAPFGFRLSPADDGRNSADGAPRPEKQS
ncbi:MAG: hypothetical protein RIR52_1590 [Acidobacteriota bacterium]